MRLATAILAVNALAIRASAKIGKPSELGQTSDLQDSYIGVEAPTQSRSPDVVALVSPSNRLIASRDLVLKLAVLPVKYQFGLDALFTKLRESVMAFVRAISQYYEVVLQNSKVRGVVGSFTSIVAGPHRQASSLTAAIEKTIRSSASGNLSAEQVRPKPITMQRAALIATLAAPLFATPALGSIPTAHRVGEASRTPSIVINSTPTVVVNSHQSGDIERQVLDALKQHRDALYEQWHREVRRRQRTEF